MKAVAEVLGVSRSNLIDRVEPRTKARGPIGPFCRAKTCSTAALTLDLAPLARETLTDMGRPGGFLR